MENQRFDELARAAAQASTRRGVLRGLGGGVLGAGLAWLGLETAAAACKKPGRKCDKNKDCCTKKCKGGRRDRRGTCRCVKVGRTCQDFDSSLCCGSSVCAESPSRCCVQNDKKCDKNSDCCGSTGSFSACENGRCCSEANTICATASGGQIGECCPGLFCELTETFRCQPNP